MTLSYHLTIETQQQILSNLHLSKDRLLEEITLLLAKRQLTDSKMEIDYFQRKYQQDFTSFDEWFHNNTASFEAENDWMAWKFATESYVYWQNLLQSPKP
jgi:hypothetical protein